ncbi:MAG: hypothetical protein WBM13_07425, partial [Bacteroidia bacterium]
TLYIDVSYMDVRALKRILEFAKKGLPVCLKNLPKEPGKVKSVNYSALCNELKALPNVSTKFDKIVAHPPLIQGDSIPDYWCRIEKDGTYYVFLAQPLSQNLQYPIYSGQSYMDKSMYRELTFTINGKTIKKNIEFKPYQSVMLKITTDGNIKYVDIVFVPKTPIIRPREPQKMHF